jgi:hypothetical protein
MTPVASAHRARRDYAGRMWSRLAAPLVLVSIVAALAGAAAGAGSAAARWTPAPTTAPWQWQLQGSVDTTVSARVYEVDGFDVPASVVAALHAQGRRVICYLDAGSWEAFRPDARDFPASVLGRRYEGYPNERWLDIRRIDALAPILERRFALCAKKGFDAVEADNVDGFDVPAPGTGFPLTAADQLRFNRWVARRVHARGMAVALKNDGAQAARLVGDFDMAVVESCFQYRECGAYRVFPKAGKAVFATEYAIEPARFCAKARTYRFSAIRKDESLRARPWRPC